jgi:transposase-like protein
VSTLTPPKSGDVGELVGLGLRRSHDSHQVRKSLLIDIPALRQRQGLTDTCMCARTSRAILENHNVVEQDHRFIKRRVNPGLGFRAFATAQRIIQGYEAMHMLHKGQIEGLAKGDVLAQNHVINQLFGLAA